MKELRKGLLNIYKDEPQKDWSELSLQEIPTIDRNIYRFILIGSEDTNNEEDPESIKLQEAIKDVYKALYLSDPQLTNILLRSIDEGRITKKEALNLFVVLSCGSLHKIRELTALREGLTVLFVDEVVFQNIQQSSSLPKELSTYLQNIVNKIIEKK
ncbi:MAG: hypothetical protein A2233_05445 [Candidatus Kerfeldbacteria bacterium RIFOXYA2_FULL_38_24]|uniref:Uncharacterized protein n=1 Tax=Candidatus Kerfeldbacteria bacterium RIFOXYB2_FULL_38_14 TaxID=1798547 RepID=A0A1G2BGJ9_9BACT|nr:MAG: hypothetical protein A2233_05445 [Candidatus Kerfeldbacteria bacterium RIFOXYA2_FULL_38_24]OGY88272.1 MAG: hypothetical protein A2319_03735 [Candidatus Kerfeldbacteria bacterium RIFOXYB2_FULL_38_14]OGY89395.1 MAG: hypothetical protein A2458_04270 [Candidatus Kerfeldbacteria bacterium RIFOXYC2_FULL_38_9]